MQANHSAPLDGPARQLLGHLIKQKHALDDGRYALFFVTGEGKYLPASTQYGRLEQSSGYVVDSHGHVFAFWLGWDEAYERPALTRWRAVDPPRTWATDEEYRAARAAVGLSSS